MSASSYMPLPASSTPASQPPSRFNLPLPWRYPPSGGASSTQPTTFDKPSLTQTLLSRPLRLVSLAAALVFALVVLGGGLGHGPAAEPVAKIGSYAQGSYWKSRRPTGGRELPVNDQLLEPELTRDPKTGFLMPPDVYPAAMNP